MDQPLFNNCNRFDNILYIGDDAGACLKIIERFTGCIHKIEENYEGLIHADQLAVIASHRLQHYIQYHFEGGIAKFRFKNEEELPAIVRNECLAACRSIAFEQLFFAS